MTDREAIKKAILAGLDKFEQEHPGSLAPNARAMAAPTLRVSTHPSFLLDADDVPPREKMVFLDFVHKRVLQ